jgi:hypothetical protein
VAYGGDEEVGVEIEAEMGVAAGVGEVAAPVRMAVMGRTEGEEHGALDGRRGLVVQARAEMHADAHAEEADERDAA